MAIQINGTNVIDNNQNIVGVAVTGSVDLSFGSGTTPTRPASPNAGMIRYNTTLSRLEVYTGTEWRYLGESGVNADNIGLFGGGTINENQDVMSPTIDYININSTSNAIRFGELSIGRKYLGACSSSTRGVFGAGSANLTVGSYLNVLDYVEISTKGNAMGFGALSETKYGVAACSNSTRGVFGGGTKPSPAYLNTIEYITIATLASVTNFGDLNVERHSLAACSSPTRGVFAGGTIPGVAFTNTIDYITSSSTGNATDFGDLSVSRSNLAACSSPTRGVFGGGSIPANSEDIIEYITFDTLGGSTLFGTLSGRVYNTSACSSPTRGVFAGGNTPGIGQPEVNTIEYITIATSSNAVNFGDLTQVKGGLTACSNVHGGIGINPGIATTALTGDIGIFAGGVTTPGNINPSPRIDYINIASTGNAIKFGELAIARSYLAACSSPTRGVFAGGSYNSALTTYLSSMEYIEIATTGNAMGFASLNEAKYGLAGCSSPTRGVFGGGTKPSPGYLNTIEYITIASASNATDFGDLTVERYNLAACSSPTRGVFAGGTIPGVAFTNTIDYITFTTLATVTDFGDLLIATDTLSACSSPTRGVFGGGYIAVSQEIDDINYITFDTLGGSTFFGNLTAARDNLAACSSPTRGVFGGGNINSIGNPEVSTIDYITIATSSNAVNFGDLTIPLTKLTACSNVHGGIGINPGIATTALTGDIGIFAGGVTTPGNSSPSPRIDYINIASTGNAIKFGELAIGRLYLGACSSPTRGVFAGGSYSNSAKSSFNYLSSMEYIEIATTGNAMAFASLNEAKYGLAGCSSPTRGVFGGGTKPSPTYLNTIEYITIATLSNALDFGDLTVERHSLAACSSPTRGVFAGGTISGVAFTNTIDYITLASTGNATDFGDLTTATDVLAACSSPTRGVFGGGETPTKTSSINYITFDTLGGSTFFGNLTQNRGSLSACSSPTRGVFAGGDAGAPANEVNTIDYITIATSSNAVNFGDLTQVKGDLTACSNVHGGIGINPGIATTALTGDIGIFAGGVTTPGNSSPSPRIDYINIASTGNAIKFGELAIARSYLAACSSPTRGVFAGGSYNSALTTYLSSMEYIEIATTGNAMGFASLNEAKYEVAACSNSTRGVFGGGTKPSPGYLNTIEYITIASASNALDFGDLTVERHSLAACSSPTRGVFAGGTVPGSGFTNTIDYITIASASNATDFGDLTTVRYNLAACSSPTRGVFGGGETPTKTSSINYITFDTLGGSTFFGNLTAARDNLAACSSPTRGVFGGGNTPAPGQPEVNTIDYITIATISNALNFGDLTIPLTKLTACSNVHGGIGINPGIATTALTGDIGIFAGGIAPSSDPSPRIDYINIASTGNTIKFGELAIARSYLAACSSPTRGVFAGGSYNSALTTYLSSMEYIEIATTGNSMGFASLNEAKYGLAGCSSPTRGVFGGGTKPSPGYLNTIEYITIASASNALDFGDLTIERHSLAACSSPTRGVFAGGTVPASAFTNTIDYITFTTLATVTDFGDLTIARDNLAACSSPTRGVFGGGNSTSPNNPTNTLDYITIASASNATDFGDLTVRRYNLAACSSPTRGVFAGGNSSAPGQPEVNTIDYITIGDSPPATTTDFGDLSQSVAFLTSCSSSHGGVT